VCAKSKPFKSSVNSWAGTATAPAAAPTDDATCMACHGQKPAPQKPGKKGPKAPPFVEAAKFADSVHAGNGCASCHTDVDLGSHPGKPVGPVVCATCHDKPSATYEASVHGKARKAGVTVERVDMADPSAREPGLRDFFEMYEATGRREGFLVRDRDYELEQWRRLGEAGLASLWLAGVDGARQTGAVLLRSGARLVYYVAGSRDDADLHRTRANHMLQWEIIRWAAAAGFTAYDMGGVDSHTAPGLPRDETHPLWNLFMFKRRFGARGSVIASAHEYAPHASLGTLWRLARRFR